jgi:hypothetical protein
VLEVKVGDSIINEVALRFLFLGIFESVVVVTAIVTVYSATYLSSFSIFNVDCEAANTYEVTIEILGVVVSVRVDISHLGFNKAEFA